MRLNGKLTIAYEPKLKTPELPVAIIAKSHSKVPIRGKADAETPKTTTFMEGSTPKTTFTASIRTLQARRTLLASTRGRTIISTDRARMTSMVPIINTVRDKVNKEVNRTRLGNSSMDRVRGTVTIRSGALRSARRLGTLGASVSQTIVGSGSSARTLKTLGGKATTSGPSSRRRMESTKTQTSTSSSKRGTGRRLMLRGVQSAKPNTGGTSPGLTLPSTPRTAHTPRLRSRAPGTPSSKAKTCSRSIATTVRKTSTVGTRSSTRSSSGLRRGSRRRRTSR